MQFKNVFRTSILICLINVCVSVSDLRVDGVKLLDKKCSNDSCIFTIEIRGANLNGKFPWGLSYEAGYIGDVCRSKLESYEIHELHSKDSSSVLNITIPSPVKNLFLCVLNGQLWLNGGVIYMEDGATLEQLVAEGNERERVSVLSEEQAHMMSPGGAGAVDLTSDIAVNFLDRNRRAEDSSNVQLLDTDYVEYRVENHLTTDEIVLDKSVKGRIRRQASAVVVEKMDLLSGDVRIQDGALVLGAGSKVDLKLTGSGFEAGQVVGLTTKTGTDGEPCEDISSGNSQLMVTSPSTATVGINLPPGNEGTYYFCIAKGDVPSRPEDATAGNTSAGNATSEPGRNASLQYSYVGVSSGVNVRTGIVLSPYAGPPEVLGVRIDEVNGEAHVGVVPDIMEGEETTLRLFGLRLRPDTAIVFTREKVDCKFPIEPEYLPEPNGTEFTQEYKIKPPYSKGDTFYICTKNADGSFTHQSSNNWIAIKTHTTFLPLWATLFFIVVCLVFASLFSGLNLGLMSLDRTELKIIAATGTEKEKKYARIIQPVRDHGNFLLCSILFGNVAVINTHTILLDQLMSGTAAVILSTLSVVLLSEIIPQAICSRHGLAIGAYTINIMKMVMGITAPLAYPVSKLLDYMLGEEIGNVYNRERLKELVKVTTDINDLDKDEVNIISGALELRKKKVIDVMTNIDDVYMLSIDSVLDFETMSEIVNSGYSRIPVYDRVRTNIVTVLFVKDLALMDPDDNTPLQTLCQFYQNPCNFVFEDVTLDVMFRQFKEGHKGHMAFIRRINNEGEGDPFYETIGLVTLEDVIEEMIQAEIVDETDVFTDNRSKRRRTQHQNKTNFAAFAEKRPIGAFKISPQLTMATFQYLTTTVDAFRLNIISENVLRRLLQQDIVHQIRCKDREGSDPSVIIYNQGKPADYFVLILEGRVEVTVGQENLVFEAGPFTYFGVQALTQNVGVADSSVSMPSPAGSLQNLNMESMLRHTFVPDYSVKAVCDTLYIVIKRSLYMAAKKASLLEQTSRSKEGGGEGRQLDDVEVDKLLQSVEDEDVENEKLEQLVTSSASPTSVKPAVGSPFREFSQKQSEKPS